MGKRILANVVHRPQFNELEQKRTLPAQYSSWMLVPKEWHVGRNNAGKEWLVLGGKGHRPSATVHSGSGLVVNAAPVASGARFWADCCSPNSLSFDLNRDGDRKLSVVSGPRNQFYRTPLGLTPKAIGASGELCHVGGVPPLARHQSRLRSLTLCDSSLSILA